MISVRQAAVERVDILSQTGEAGQLYLWGLIRDSHALPLCVLIFKILSSLAAFHSNQVATMLRS